MVKETSHKSSKTGAIFSIPAKYLSTTTLSYKFSIEEAPYKLVKVSDYLHVIV